MVCRQRDAAPSAVLRDLVRLEVRRMEGRSARAGAEQDDATLARLRQVVGQALEQVQDWAGLQAALVDVGVVVRPAGTGLNLADALTGEVLCKISDVGPGYLTLVRQFGAGFPGHPRPGIAAAALAPRPPLVARSLALSPLRARQSATVIQLR